MLLRGILLLLSTIASDTPGGVAEAAWNAIQEGSPQDFLGTLTFETSDSVLDVCETYLEKLKTLDHEQLGEIFASVRLEAAPNEIEYWDGMAVLEMVMSSPKHHSMLQESQMTVDSVHSRDSSATVYVTVSIPGVTTQQLELPAEASPLGWRMGAMAPIVDSALHHLVVE
jgi:hypothetical protein